MRTVAHTLVASALMLTACSPQSSSNLVQPDAASPMDLATARPVDMATAAACALTVPATVGYKLTYEVDDGTGTLASRVDTEGQTGAFFGRMATQWSLVVDDGTGPSSATVHRAVDVAGCARAEYDDFESLWFNTVPGPAQPAQSGTTQIGGTSWSYNWVVAPSTVVPAGTFSNCMKLTRTAADNRMIEQVHCAGVGMVLQLDTPAPSIVVTTRLKSM